MEPLQFGVGVSNFPERIVYVLTVALACHPDAALIHLAGKNEFKVTAAFVVLSRVLPVLGPCLDGIYDSAPPPHGYGWHEASTNAADGAAVRGPLWLPVSHEGCATPGLLGGGR